MKMSVKYFIIVLFVFVTLATGIPQFEDNFPTPRYQWYKVPSTDHRGPPGPLPRQPHHWRSPYPSPPEHRSPFDRWPPSPSYDHQGPPGHRRPPGFDLAPSNFHDNRFPPHDRRPPPFDHEPPGHRHHSSPNHRPYPPGFGPHQPPDRPFHRPDHRPYPQPDYRPHIPFEYESHPTDHRLPPPDQVHRPSHNHDHNHESNSEMDNSHVIVTPETQFQTHNTQPIQSHVELESSIPNKSTHIRDTNQQRDEVQQFNGEVNQGIIDNIFGKNPQANDGQSVALASDVSDSQVTSAKPTPHKFQVIPVTPES